MMHRTLTNFLAILLAALTAACSSTLPGTDAQIVPLVAPVDYRKIIRAEVPSTLTNGAQVSELRKAVAPQLYDWVACLKTTPNVSFYAVFFEGEKVKDFRRSVQIDQCESADYSPLTPPAPAKKTQLKQKKDNTKSNATPQSGKRTNN
jgi:hypothetical protein